MLTAIKNKSLLFLSLLFLVSFCSVTNAHDIPSKVTLFVYVKPEGNQLKAMVRVPMEALSEISFPLKGPGYLDFSKVDAAMHDAAEVYIKESIHLYEGENLLTGKHIEAVRIDLPSNRSFTQYDSAIENILSPPLPANTELYWAQGVMDVLVTYPITSEDSKFSIQSDLGQLGVETNTVLRFILPSGSERVFNYFGDPGLVSLNPGFFQAIFRFIELGFFHILDGLDHLLFLFCLVIPLRNLKSLIPVVTSFTIAHSITLISSAFGIAPNALWFPPLIETLIALSIVYMACENILGADLSKRWMITFGFGLVHGFGFSFVLADSMQFAGSHLFTSLLAFNVGVELGQLLVLIIVIPILMGFFKLRIPERVGVILLSSFVVHSAWHWMSERSEQLFQYEFSSPSLGYGFFAALTRWLILILISVGILWLLSEIFKRFKLTANSGK
ncbi:HupE/UreJ family protein [Aurantivibrio infirmus]